MDFSQNMLDGARKKFGDGIVRYFCQDYALMNIPAGNYNIITSVIGLHHQTDVGKVLMFEKIRKGLEPGNGVFIFGDLFTFRKPQTAALAAAKHYHHMFLNQLAPIEDQLNWLIKIGFEQADVKFVGSQTALIIAR